MTASQNAARIQMRDVQELNESSEALAAVADMIKRANPTWKDGAIALLIQANDRILRLQQKGARAFQRYYEKTQAQPASVVATEIAAMPTEAASGETEPGEN